MNRSLSLSLRFAVLVTSFSFLEMSHACPVFSSSGQKLEDKTDVLFQLLQLRESCPQNVMELRSLIQSEGGTFKTTMVANRGFHNPSQGSFSFFETVEIQKPARLTAPIKSDELFFGHFTAPAGNNTLTLDQNSLSPSLMIELIAWDQKNEMYNFYELVGSPQGPKWFYRGNSADVWSDTAQLHRIRRLGKPVFGQKLRCSGCHIAGGPIMKELTEPHDSWWSSERPLPFAGRAPDPQMQEVMKTLLDPDHLQDQAISGLKKLMSGKSFKSKQAVSPQIALRPLFCPEEINLEATLWPFDSGVNKVLAPTGFFLDERLLRNHRKILVSKEFYVNSLNNLKSRFPETNRMDADHAWNTPVKANSDIIAINALVSNKVIDEEFVADVLALDMTRPVFSPTRCGLLNVLPNQWSQDWQDKFKDKLMTSRLPGSKELYEHLTDVSRSKEFHQARAIRFLERCNKNLMMEQNVYQMIRYLNQVRGEVSASEISQNPRGQILEPGFRVIFPKFNLQSTPWQLSLDDECQVR